MESGGSQSRSATPGPVAGFLAGVLLVAWGDNSAPTSQSLNRIRFVNLRTDLGQSPVCIEGCRNICYSRLGLQGHPLGLRLKLLSWQTLVSSTMGPWPP